MSEDVKMSFWDHLDEFRNRLFIILGAVFLGAIIGYYYSENIIQFLLLPSDKFKVSFQVITITSMFVVKLAVSFFTGLVIGFPVLIYNLISFIGPAFQSDDYREKAVDITGLFKLELLVLFSFIFFLSGIFFGYYVIIPFLLTFFTSIVFNDVSVVYNFTLGSYLNYTVWTLFLNGLIFQMPIIAFIGSKIGILTPEFLQHYRRHSIIFFLILSALITPPDPLSQILICVPFIVLYELSIIVSKIFKNKK